MPSVLCVLCLNKNISGVYPYEFAKNMDCYKDTQLPPKDAFYSNLSMSGISDKEYKHAKRWGWA